MCIYPSGPIPQPTPQHPPCFSPFAILSLPFPDQSRHTASWQALTHNKQHTSGNKKAEEEASKDADEQVKGIKDAGGKKGDQVVEDLLRVVTDVQPVVPERVVVPGKA